jgi:predicted Fe-Mo cluster-binding NifX family protein
LSIRYGINARGRSDGTLDALDQGEVSMKVAIPIWKERVSPVFDTAESLLVVSIDGAHEESRYRIELVSRSLPVRTKRLTANGVDVLICGAISRDLFDMLEAAGIKVMPFLSGQAETLLTAFMENRISDPQYLMPGCCGKRCGHHRRETRGEGRRS